MPLIGSVSKFASNVRMRTKTHLLQLFKQLNKEKSNIQFGKRQKEYELPLKCSLNFCYLRVYCSQKLFSGHPLCSPTIQSQMSNNTRLDPLLQPNIALIVFRTTCCTDENTSRTLLIFTFNYIKFRNLVRCSHEQRSTCCVLPII